MSFKIALSDRKVEAIMASSNSITKKVVTKFVSNLWAKLRKERAGMENACLIYDNTSCHINKEVNEFLQRKEICVLSIPPYSPQLNWAEKVIAYIKNRLVQAKASSEVMSLSLVRKIISEMTAETPKMLWRSSFIETLKKMKTLIKLDSRTNIRFG